MSLQRRLTLFFITIVMLPLLAAGLVVGNVLVGEAEKRSEMALGPALDSTLTGYNLRVASMDEVVIASAAPGVSGDLNLGRLLRTGDRNELARKLAARVEEETSLDFMAVVDGSGRTIAFESSRKPEFAPGFVVSEGTILRAAKSAGPNDHIVFGDGFATTAAFEIKEGSGTTLGSVLGGFWIDEESLAGASEETELAIRSGGEIIATTAQGDTPFEGDVASSFQQEDLNRGVLVAWAPAEDLGALSRKVFIPMLLLLLLALVMIAFLAYWLAKLITQPLEEVAHGAEAIAHGNYDYQIPVDSSDEVGQLAMAFNNMTDRLRETITELSSSRGLLQRAVRRVGETLRSTHDMRQILDSILHTAADAVGGDAAVLWSFTPDRAELYPAIGASVNVDRFDRVQVGSGVVGHVAERGIAMLRPGGNGGPSPTSAEPDYDIAIVVPLYSQDRIHAVISVYRKTPAQLFTEDDLGTVVFLAEQGGVALENVQLHEEAQRLSITDGLTGVWNRRYFQMQFRQVLATSTRFERTFSILMLDLDNFKGVNDTFGHQRGDAILIEFARRVSHLLREVDTVARYGGEEFICLLSETDLDGALITAEKIRDAVRSASFDHQGEERIDITVSIGVACFPAHGESYQGLVGAADAAMYRAKQEGRDCIRVAEKPSGNLKLAK